MRYMALFKMISCRHYFYSNLKRTMKVSFKKLLKKTKRFYVGLYGSEN